MNGAQAECARYASSHSHDAIPDRRGHAVAAGGVIGLALGYLIGVGAAGMIPGLPDAMVPWWAVLMAFGFSSMVGIVFGIMPAAKAANLNPIDALRYE